MPPGKQEMKAGATRSHLSAQALLPVEDAIQNLDDLIRIDVDQQQIGAIAHPAIAWRWRIDAKPGVIGEEELRGKEESRQKISASPRSVAGAARIMKDPDQQGRVMVAVIDKGAVALVLVREIRSGGLERAMVPKIRPGGTMAVTPISSGRAGSCVRQTAGRRTAAASRT